MATFILARPENDVDRVLQLAQELGTSAAALVREFLPAVVSVVEQAGSVAVSVSSGSEWSVRRAFNQAASKWRPMGNSVVAAVTGIWDSAKAAVQTAYDSRSYLLSKEALEKGLLEVAQPYVNALVPAVLNNPATALTAASTVRGVGAVVNKVESTVQDYPKTVAAGAALTAVGAVLALWWLSKGFEVGLGPVSVKRV